MAIIVWRQLMIEPKQGCPQDAMAKARSTLPGNNIARPAESLV